MRADLRCALITVCAIAFAFGNLHDIGRVAAQEEGPAGACAKGTDQSNATLATAYMNAFAAADDRVFDEILSVDYMHHFGIGKDASTPSALKQKVAEWHAAFQGGPFDIEQVIVSGDMVVVRWRRSGTQVGAFDGIGPSAVETTYTGINIFRIKCNKIAESWNESDHLGRLQAAGVLTSDKLSTPSRKP
jgi:predicted ester cyclase